MRRAAILVLLLTGLHVARAEDSMESARQRVLNDAVQQAVEDAKRQPALTDRDFVKWWRPALARLTKQICACEFNDKTCARLAMDEFTVDLVQAFFRVKGVLEALEETDDPKALGRELSEAFVKKHVSPKERLRLQARLERCTYHAVGQRLTR